MSERVFLLLGSNVGDRTANISAAISLFKDHGIELVHSSRIYQSPPWGFKEQEAFLNQAVEIKTELEPEALLTQLKSIEEKTGRKLRRRWGPREIDIDILIYGNRQHHSKTLTIPHPELANRSFALVPLSEIDSSINVPGLGDNILSLLNQRADKSEITSYQ